MHALRSGACAAVIGMMVGCASSPPTYRSFGYEVIEADVDRSVVRQAIDDTYDQLGTPIEREDGSTSDPSYAEWSRSWRQGDVEKPQVIRSGTRFTGAEGTEYEIEALRIAGRPTLLFLESDNREATLALFNAMSAALARGGVAVKGD